MYRRILCKEVNALNKVFEAIASWWEWMVSIAMNFQFKDAVDIIIVAFLIYGVVKLVRETRAGQLVKGLFLLVVLFIISSYFNLVMVSRVLAYFFQFAFVAILIVFQPEIRKALEQVGRNNVGQSIAAVVTGRDRSYDRAQIRKAINAVVDGVGILQQLKMGALIVFERKTKLGDIIETGTQINCEPSGQIVGNIFFNKAPLHDGAMIIRDGMIHAAGFFIMYWQTAVTGRCSKQPHQLRVFHLHAPEVLHGDVLDLAHNARVHGAVAHDQDVLSLPQLRLDHFFQKCPRPGIQILQALAALHRDSIGLRGSEQRVDGVIRVILKVRCALADAEAHLLQPDVRDDGDLPSPQHDLRRFHGPDQRRTVTNINMRIPAGSCGLLHHGPSRLAEGHIRFPLQLVFHIPHGPAVAHDIQHRSSNPSVFVHSLFMIRGNGTEVNAYADTSRFFSPSSSSL